MKAGILVAMTVALVLFAAGTLAADEQAKPADRAALKREVDKRKTKFAEAGEDLEAVKQGAISLRLTGDEQKIDHVGKPPEYAFRSQGAKTSAIRMREAAVREVQKAYRSAVANLKSLTDADAEAAAKAFEKGNALLEQNDLGSAISAFTDAIRLDPQHVEAYYWRGFAYAKQNDLDKAIADYSEAIRLDPKHAAAYQRRGMAHQQQGDKLEAEKDFAEAKRLESKGQ